MAQNPQQDLDAEAAWPTLLTRAFPLKDVAKRSGKVTCETCGQDATGRMVDHYVAPFGEQTEVHDGHGDYIEEIDPAAFNRRLDHLARAATGLRGVGVFYNHAKTLYDTPSELYSVPVGHPAMLSTDASGLIASTHYSRDEASDRIFQGVVDGNIAGHSFTGRIVRSNPNRVPRRAHNGDLPVVRRLELGLSEYGPTPVPYYAGTPVVAVRSTLQGQHFGMDSLVTTPPLPPSGPGTEDSRVSALRSAEIRHAQALRRARLLAIGVINHGKQADPA